MRQFKFGLAAVGFGISLALAGCGIGMMSDVELMRAVVDDGRVETAVHRQAAVAAATLPEMQIEMIRHARVTAGMMNDLADGMDGMATHCQGSGMGEMRAMHGDLDGEMARHAAAMASLADLGASRAEVERHAEAANVMMGAMDDAMERMTCGM